MSEPAEGARLIPGKEIAVSEEKFPDSDRPSGTSLLSSTHTSTNTVSHWTLDPSHHLQHRHHRPYLIFVIFSPPTQFLTKFFSTQKRVNHAKTDLTKTA